MKFLPLSHLNPDERARISNVYAAGEDEPREVEVTIVQDPPQSVEARAMAKVAAVHGETSGEAA